MQRRTNGEWTLFSNQHDFKELNAMHMNWDLNIVLNHEFGFNEIIGLY